ncbi:FAD-binding oxidoreductase [Gordonia sp. PDNC005]|uniref:FAD-binding oxidoreductase n=1 Tax=unclassified Gordonia (in: high G+C Gram-positive bacteria) TaxID=2657482 RepID=UPI001966BB6C|nr:FAD-binding oxidoreductase [Gordonia sp. PDNC005]QRY61421.1 FAD-binding oxidoreductase [Gordonia sp. PDNC005]
MAVPNAQVVRALRAIVGDTHVVTESDVAAPYLTDWTGEWHGDAAVVRPGDTAEVAAVLRLCTAHEVKVTPQGGNTGLVGGSTPPPNDSRPWVLLSLRRLDTVGLPDGSGMCIRAGAGATLTKVHTAATAVPELGLMFGVDLAARDSATIGGMVATNAGGIRMIRYGDMRSQVLGLEAVLPSGEVFSRWRPLRKDNVGYHLPGLITGSEGTLAVVTRVLLRLVQRTYRTGVALVGAADVDAARRVLFAVQRSGHTIEAAEIMTRTGVDLVAQTGVRTQIDAGATLLVEIVGGVEELSESLARAGDDVLDAVVDAGPARELWRVRESHTETIARSSTTPPVKLDVSVPMGDVHQLITRVEEFAGRSGVRAVQFGHIGDGNIHVNLLDVPAEKRQTAADGVLGIVVALGGSISAEHGIGRAKAASISLGRDAVDVAAMRAIKSALDPGQLMNPGVIFDESR